MLNQCTLTGNLGGDPEVFYSSEGNPVASFSLAFHSSKKKTGWIKVVCFQKLAEVTQKYLHKRSIMPFELLHFRDSEKILKSKKMEKDVHATLEYLDDALYGSIHRRELLSQALDEMECWHNNETLIILEGRRYRFKGFKKGVAIEASFSAYEFILEGLVRLQIGYDKKKIEKHADLHGGPQPLLGN
jgi:hypothetical protein